MLEFLPPPPSCMLPSVHTVCLLSRGYNLLRLLTLERTTVHEMSECHKMLKNNVLSVL